jgi:heme exporter protein A
VTTAAVAPPAAPASAGARLVARGLGHRYGRRVALEGMSFELTAPALVAVTGPNGSGKSTLLRILAGLLRPSAGDAELTVGGAGIEPAERARRVGYAAPELTFYPELSAAENLRFAAEARALPAAAERARRALERVGLLSRAGDRVAALSSGMVQRLRLAFAVLHAPPVLLLDEAMSHLDDEGRTLLGALVAEQATTGLVILATNDEREARLAGRRIELRGRGLGDPA